MSLIPVELVKEMHRWTQERLSSECPLWYRFIVTNAVVSEKVRSATSLSSGVLVSVLQLPVHLRGRSNLNLMPMALVCRSALAQEILCVHVA